jgi:hypothetical protein
MHTTPICIEDEFKNLIPPLSPEEYAQLEQNILADGCRDPLLLWNEVLLDGHNRYEICQRHGLSFKTEQITTLETFDDAVLWIIEHQLGRRNITDFARTELALRAKPIIEARAKAKQATSTGGVNPQLMQNSAEAAPITTRDEIAKVAGVSHDTVRKVEKIIEKATAEVITQVRTGEISINAAAKTVAPPKITPSQEAPPPASKVPPAPESPKPENPYAPDKINGVEHLTEQLIELSESLKSTLADNEMMGRVFDADDRLKAAMDEAKRQKAIADNAERTLAAKKGEYIARAEQVTYWKNRAEKAEKALAKAAA